MNYVTGVWAVVTVALALAGVVYAEERQELSDLKHRISQMRAAAHDIAHDAKGGTASDLRSPAAHEAFHAAGSFTEDQHTALHALDSGDVADLKSTISQVRDAARDARGGDAAGVRSAATQIHHAAPRPDRSFLSNLRETFRLSRPEPARRTDVVGVSGGYDVRSLRPDRQDQWQVGQ